MSANRVYSEFEKAQATDMDIHDKKQVFQDALKTVAVPTTLYRAFEIAILGHRIPDPWPVGSRDGTNLYNS